MADTPYSPPPVHNRDPKPPGILPKNAQGLVIAGVALLMVIAIALSGGKAPKRTVSPLPAPLIVDPNEARIQEYRSRIEQQAQKLALEQARLVQARQTLAALPPGSAALATPDVSAGRGINSAEPTAYVPSGRAEPERNWIDMDWEKRKHVSRFSSNLAFTRRDASAPRRPETDEDDSSPAEDQAANKSSPTGARELRQATGKRYRVFEGSVLETVLTNRLDGSFSGPVNCMVTTNLYSHNRRKLLIPQGTRLLGDVSKVDTFGQRRLAVTFKRLIMPDGYSVSLEKLPGLNQQGETGLIDKVDHHYFQIFGISLAIGAIAGLSHANTQYGVNTSGSDVYRQGIASSLSQSSLNILDRYLNVLPTFTILEGHRVKVYLTGDLLLPAYENHQLPSDL